MKLKPTPKLSLTSLVLTLVCLVAPAHSIAQIYSGFNAVASSTSTSISAAGLSGAGISTPLSVEAIATGATESMALGGFSWSIDGSGNLNVSFSSSFTGNVLVNGPWPNYTTTSGDFKVAHTSYNGVDTLFDCYDCATYPVSRYLPANGKTYVTNCAKYLEWPDSPSSAVDIYVYIRGNRIVYGISQSTPDSGADPYDADIEWGVASMPSGVVPLGDTTITSGSFGAINDDRPANWTSTTPSWSNEPVIIIVNCPNGGNNTCSPECLGAKQCVCSRCTSPVN